MLKNKIKKNSFLFIIAIIVFLFAIFIKPLGDNKDFEQYQTEINRTIITLTSLENDYFEKNSYFLSNEELQNLYNINQHKYINSIVNLNNNKNGHLNIVTTYQNKHLIIQLKPLVREGKITKLWNCSILYNNQTNNCNKILDIKKAIYEFS